MIQRKLADDDETSSGDEGIVSSRNSLNDLTGKEWIQDTASIWYQRGLGKGHPETVYERQHPAPFAFLMVERLVRFFTKKGQLVLDPFVGVGSTLKACALAGRRGLGIELSDHWVDLARLRLKEEANGGDGQEVLEGDARDVMKKLPESEFDFAVTSPPYWGILNKPADHRVKAERLKNNLATRYSDNPLDLANIANYEEFLRELKTVFAECHRVLKGGKYIAVVVSDFRHKSRYVAYHSHVSELLEEIGFVPKGVIIYVKNAKKLYPYGYPFSFVPNIHHEYILIFMKDGADEPEGPNESRDNQ